jgi:hypothetical protein
MYFIIHTSTKRIQIAFILYGKPFLCGDVRFSSVVVKHYLYQLHGLQRSRIYKGLVKEKY